MPDHLLFDLQQHGHLSRVSSLRAAGHTRGEIQAAVRGGTVIRVARDWIATPAASQIPVVALGFGGRLTGSTALASYGVWDAVDRRIHIALRPNAHGTRVQLSTPIAVFVPPKFTPGAVKLHWRREAAPVRNAAPWRVSVIDALVVVESESAPDQFVACVDSALHTAQISRASIPILFSALPDRAQHLRELIDPSAETGLESLARQRLRRIVEKVEPQVVIPGIGRLGGEGRVDLLLDSWLVIELDGDEFHDPKTDRVRNSILVRMGYRIHRFGFDQTVFDWPAVEATVLELLGYVPDPSKSLRRS